MPVSVAKHGDLQVQQEESVRGRWTRMVVGTYRMFQYDTSSGNACHIMYQDGIGNTTSPELTVLWIKTELLFRW